jgi:hypothetical protein
MMALKIAKAVDVPVDYLLGEGKYSSYSKETVNHIEEMKVWTTKLNRCSLISSILYIHDAKTHKVHAL